jgi:hypothetical protein
MITSAQSSDSGADRKAFDELVEAKRAARARLLARYGGPNGTHVPVAAGTRVVLCAVHVAE